MITVGELFAIFSFPPEFEFIYTDSDREYDEMFPHFVSGMSEDFYAVLLDCAISVIDFKLLVIELDGRMVYDELLNYRKLKNNILDSPE